MIVYGRKIFLYRDKRVTKKINGIICIFIIISLDFETNCRLQKTKFYEAVCDWIGTPCTVIVAYSLKQHFQQSIPKWKFRFKFT